jgi:hypothetical protein
MDSFLRAANRCHQNESPDAARKMSGQRDPGRTSTGDRDHRTRLDPQTIQQGDQRLGCLEAASSGIQGVCP